MSYLKRLFVLPLTLATIAPCAHAQFAVIDVASVTQLMTQVQTLEQQLATARAELGQVQAAYQAITGGRGMENLLSGTVRNYLPPDWASVQAAAAGASGAYPQLSGDVQRALDANARLSAGQLAALSRSSSIQLQSDRQSVALMQVMAHEALARVSSRFDSMQQLIDALAGAGDQKSVLDLQARIAAEQAMLVNEQTKLQTLFQAARADERAGEQQLREQVVAGHGSFAGRFQPVP